LALALAVWGLTDVRNRGRVDPDDPLAHKTDFTVFTEAGAAFFDGRNPYDVSNPRGWRYLYPPLFAILVSPLAALDPQWQAVVWYFISLAFAYGCHRESIRIWRLAVAARATQPSAGAQRAPPIWLGAIAAATLALPALNCLQRGQVGILVVYLILLGYRLTAENRSWWGPFAGGAALAGSIAIKLTPALPALFLLGLLLLAAYSGRWSAVPTRRFAGALAGTGIGLLWFIIILPGLAIGDAANLKHLHTWIDRVVVHNDMGEENNSGFYSVRNQSLANAVQRLGNWSAYALAGGPSDLSGDDVTRRPAAAPIDQPAVQHALAPVRLALLALLVIGGWRTARRGGDLEMAAMFGLSSTLTLVISPLSWAHHYLLWLPGLLLVPAWQWQAGRTGKAKALAISACGLMVAHYLLLDWTGRAGVLGLGTTIWFIVAVRTAARGDLEHRALRIDPADRLTEAARQAA
jgi:hypothetical protein